MTIEESLLKESTDVGEKSIVFSPPKIFKAGMKPDELAVRFGIDKPPVEMIHGRGAMVSEMMLPPIKEDVLVGLPKVSNSDNSITGSTADVYFAEMVVDGEERQVILKCFKDSDPDISDGRFGFEKEILRGNFLAHEGIGPRIHGWTTVGEDDKMRHVLVLDAVAGYDVLGQKLPKNVINKQTIRDLQKIEDVILKNNVVMPDFQVRITPNGRLMVIDLRNPYPLSRIDKSEDKDYLVKEFRGRVESQRRQLKKQMSIVNKLRRD